MGPKTLRVVVRNPKTILFDAQAVAVSSTNAAGNFDVLPEHANFITLIKQKPVVVHLEGGKTRSFTFSFAVLYNAQNTLTIYTDIALPEFASLA